MSQLMSRRGLFAIAGVVLAAGAASAQEAGVYVQVGPPPLRREPRPPRPGERFEWEPGHWRWDGRVHVWEPGIWIERPMGRGHWVVGHWRREPRGWVWIPGHWV